MKIDILKATNKTLAKDTQLRGDEVACFAFFTHFTRFER